MKPSTILNLGCGQWIMPDADNIDTHPLPGVDTQWNLDTYPWPYPDTYATEVRAYQVFEHIADPIAFMAEAHRILQPGCPLHIVTPHWQTANSYTDPTHRRHCTENTWDYWCPGTALHTQFGAAYAGPSTFTRTNVYRSGDDLYATLTRQ